MATKTIIIRIKRQQGPHEPSYWEEFEIPYAPQMNIISCLMVLQRNPVNRRGEVTTPPSWDCSCLEEVCGACSMVINGKPQQACSTLVDKLSSPIVLEPLTKFPVVRDLVVDRSKFFSDLKRCRTWIETDGTHHIGAGPEYSPALQELRYLLSRCMTCGCCLEVCPQYDADKLFVGPAVLAQVLLFNTHPTGRYQREGRYAVLAEPGGLADCGNAQNCVRVCPKQIPLTEAISELGREMFFYTLRNIFSIHSPRQGMPSAPPG